MQVKVKVFLFASKKVIHDTVVTAQRCLFKHPTKWPVVTGDQGVECFPTEVDEPGLIPCDE